jgi:hypothetical protein
VKDLMGTLKLIHYLMNTKSKVIALSSTGVENYTDFPADRANSSTFPHDQTPTIDALQP